MSKIIDLTLWQDNRYLQNILKHHISDLYTYPCRFKLNDIQIATVVHSFMGYRNNGLNEFERTVIPCIIKIQKAYRKKKDLYNDINMYKKMLRLIKENRLLKKKIIEATNSIDSFIKTLRN